MKDDPASVSECGFDEASLTQMRGIKMQERQLTPMDAPSARMHADILEPACCCHSRFPNFYPSDAGYPLGVSYFVLCVCLIHYDPCPEL